MAEQSRKRIYQKGAGRDGGSRQSQREARPKVNAWLVAAALILLIVFVFVSGLVKAPNVPLSLAQNQGTSSIQERVQETYGVTFLNYTHPDFGFSVSYPAGYLVSSSSVGATALSLDAVTSDGFPASMRFIISNETLSESFFNATVRDIISGASSGNYSVTAYGRVSLGGKTFDQFSVKQSSGLIGENFLNTFSFINCKGYSLVITSSVPESAKSEELIFSSVLESLKC